LRYIFTFLIKNTKSFWKRLPEESSNQWKSITPPTFYVQKWNTKICQIKIVIAMVSNPLGIHLLASYFYVFQNMTKDVDFCWRTNLLYLWYEHIIFKHYFWNSTKFTNKNYNFLNLFGSEFASWIRFKIGNRKTCKHSHKNIICRLLLALKN
jgi:hypothetical protein